MQREVVEDGGGLSIGREARRGGRRVATQHDTEMEDRAAGRAGRAGALRSARLARKGALRLTAPCSLPPSISASLSLPPRNPSQPRLRARATPLRSSAATSSARRCAKTLEVAAAAAAEWRGLSLRSKLCRDLDNSLASPHHHPIQSHAPAAATVNRRPSATAARSWRSCARSRRRAT